MIENLTSRIIFDSAWFIQVILLIAVVVSVFILLKSLRTADPRAIVIALMMVICVLMILKGANHVGTIIWAAIGVALVYLANRFIRKGRWEKVVGSMTAIAGLIALMTFVHWAGIAPAKAKANIASVRTLFFYDEPTPTSQVIIETKSGELFVADGLRDRKRQPITKRAARSKMEYSVYTEASKVLRERARHYGQDPERCWILADVVIRPDMGEVSFVLKKSNWDKFSPSEQQDIIRLLVTSVHGPRLGWGDGPFLINSGTKVKFPFLDGDESAPADSTEQGPASSPAL